MKFVVNFREIPRFCSNYVQNGAYGLNLRDFVNLKTIFETAIVKFHKNEIWPFWLNLINDSLVNRLISGEHIVPFYGESMSHHLERFFVPSVECHYDSFPLNGKLGL